MHNRCSVVRPSPPLKNATGEQGDRSGVNTAGLLFMLVSGVAADKKESGAHYNVAVAVAVAVADQSRVAIVVLLLLLSQMTIIANPLMCIQLPLLPLF